MTTADIAAELPAYHLGHGTRCTPDQVRDRLAAVHAYDPQLAASLTEGLMVSALRLITDGHPDPARLATHTLTACGRAR